MKKVVTVPPLTNKSSCCGGVRFAQFISGKGVCSLRSSFCVPLTSINLRRWTPEDEIQCVFRHCGSMRVCSFGIRSSVQRQHSSIFVPSHRQSLLQSFSLRSTSAPIAAVRVPVRVPLSLGNIYERGVITSSGCSPHSLSSSFPKRVFSEQHGEQHSEQKQVLCLYRLCSHCSKKERTLFSSLQLYC